jgi:ABC-type transport system substrate-binding protein
MISLMMLLPATLAISAPDFPLETGPFIDRLVFKTDAANMNDRILKLLNNEVDVIGTAVPPSYMTMLQEAIGLETVLTTNNRFGYIAFNTRLYPLNLSVFRRALAIAIDKEFICDEIWNGFAVPQDTPLPTSSIWSAEDYLDEHYYQGDIERANLMLDEAGFHDIDADGWREAPDGSDFHLDIETAYTDLQWQVVEVIEAALHFMGISARGLHAEWNEYLARLNFHGHYHIAFLEEVPDTYDISWLATNFHSGSAEIPYYNIPNFQNETYDSYFNQMIYSTEYDEVREAAIEMQKILTYECPIVACYVSSQISAYRTDLFTDFCNDFEDGIGSWWSYYKARLKNPIDEIQGGTLRVAGFGDPPTFNFMVNPKPLGWDILGEVYDSLTRLTPNGDDLAWLAESYTIDTHETNSDVIEGYTRLTFDVVQNATWSDGVPLTAADVAFSLNYYRDCIDDNPFAVGLRDLMAAYAAGAYRVIVEFNTESYWHLHTVGFKPIIPYHIFKDIGLEGWNEWNPIPPNETLVTSGPFVLESYVANSTIELVRHPAYFRRPIHTTGSTTTTGTTTVTTSTDAVFDPTLLWSVVFVVGIAAVPITIGAVFLLKTKVNQ